MTSLSGFVEAQVARTPNAEAVVGRNATLSYRQLDRLADGLASELLTRGAGPEVPVAVLAERSPEMVVALLAVLKAGAACLPLDPTSPLPRLDYLLADSAAPVIVGHAGLVDGLGRTGVQLIRLTPVGEMAPGPPAPASPTSPPDPPHANPRTPIAAPPGPDGLAFLLYTSGTTGSPKGVMLTHQALVNHHHVVAPLYGLGPGDRVLQFCSPSFDVAIEEIFPTLAAGATLVLRDDPVPILGQPWLDWLAERRVTLLNLPTAYWHEWVRDLAALGAMVPPAVRLVTIGGEKALGGAYRHWLAVGGDRVRWINLYGPTEATIGATFFEPTPGAALDWVDPPIGRPFPGTTAQVLDPAGQPVSDQEIGELYLGGDRLARGYWGRPDLTAERFMPEPFATEPGARRYRTGDLVRRRADGDLEFVGRVDDQVKVRGFRIEPREVAAALLAHPAVTDAVVVAREDTPGARRLVAYAVPAPAPAVPKVSGVELRRFLAERLPRSMVPAQVVVLDQLPMTPGGKVDHLALPAPTPVTAGGAAPESVTEVALAKIWSQVLGLDGIGLDDDFFDLGGHSLLATQVVVKAREAVGVEVTLGDVFDAPTVRKLAARIDNDTGAGGSLPALLAVPRAPGDLLPVTLAQQQMWDLEAEAAPPRFYNITAIRRFPASVDPALLARAVAVLVGRHESLRTSFRTEGGRLFQVVDASATLELPVTDIAEADLERQVAADDLQVFDPAVAPLLRTRLYRTGMGAALVATFDHLIADGTSVYVFLSELDEVYAALADGRAPSLAPLVVQYADFAVWQRRWLTEELLASQLSYWREKLRAMPLGPALPFDNVPSAPSRRILKRDLTLTAPASDALRRLAAETRSTVFVVVTAVVQAALSIRGGQTDVVLSTTLSGRQRAELEGVIGHFAGIGRLRTDLSGDPTVAELVARARETVVGLFDHQDVPFMRIRAAVSADFPTMRAGDHPLAALPIELQYFHAGADAWAPGLGVVEQQGDGAGPGELFFRGQLHPLSITFLDDGTRLWGEVTYKVDFYEPATIEALSRLIERLLAVVAEQPQRRLSHLGDFARTEDVGTRLAPHRPVGSWRLEH